VAGVSDVLSLFHQDLTLSVNPVHQDLLDSSIGRTTSWQIVVESLLALDRKNCNFSIESDITGSILSLKPQ
jgi:hypothetical protein